MKNVLLFFWQLPQIIIGFFVWVYYLATNKILIDERYGIREDRLIDGVYHVPLKGKQWGISLGGFVFYTVDNPLVMAHELGHVLQSHKWGLLYLLVIGIPGSIARLIAQIQIWTKTYSGWYFYFYTEKEANANAGIIDDELSL
jgi:hypothetical protein